MQTLTTKVNGPYKYRAWTSKICTTFGLVFIFLGLMGVMFPDFMRLHLNIYRNFAHIFLGLITLGVSYSKRPYFIYIYSAILGLFFSFLAITGWVFGVQGVSTTGNLAADQSLVELIPGIFEYGSADHMLHAFLGIVFLFSAFEWKHLHDDGDKAIIDVQRRREI